MASFTLDDIRAAAERKYGSTDIQVGDVTVRLLNPMRLPREKRAELTAVQAHLGAEDDETETEDQADVMRDAIRVVAENDHQADALLGAVGDDLAMLAEIFSTYSTSQEAGEASASVD